MPLVRTIGKRISIKSNKDKTTVVITTGIASWKEALLAAWILCWLVCLGVFISELFKPHTDKEHIILFGIIVFMVYYAVRIIKVYAWRKWGMEFIKITDTALTYKRSIRKWGKAHQYFLENIKDISLVTKEDGSIAKLLENSFWVRGGQRVSFDYLEKLVRIGIQLNDADAKAFSQWLHSHVRTRLSKKGD